MTMVVLFSVAITESILPISTVVVIVSVGDQPHLNSLPSAAVPFVNIEPACAVERAL